MAIWIGFPLFPNCCFLFFSILFGKKIGGDLALEEILFFSSSSHLLMKLLSGCLSLTGHLWKPFSFPSAAWVSINSDRFLLSLSFLFSPIFSNFFCVCCFSFLGSVSSERCSLHCCHWPIPTNNWKHSWARRIQSITKFSPISSSLTWCPLIPGLFHCILFISNGKLIALGGYLWLPFQDTSLFPTET